MSLHEAKLAKLSQGSAGGGGADPSLVALLRRAAAACACGPAPHDSPPPPPTLQEVVFWSTSVILTRAVTHQRGRGRGERRPRLKAQELSNVLWALASLQAPPERADAAPLLQRAREVAPLLSPQVRRPRSRLGECVCVCVCVRERERER